MTLNDQRASVTSRRGWIGQLAGTATARAWVRVGILICLGAIAVPSFASADPSQGVPPQTVPVTAGQLPPEAVRHLDQQLADLGRPAFVDGLAGLLLVHARRQPAVAGAMARRVLARAPAARSEVARALRLAGFDPAIAGLDDRPGGQRAAPPPAVAVAGLPAVAGAGVPAGAGAALRDGQRGQGAARRQTGGGAGGAGGAGVTFSVPMDTPVPTSGAATLRPGPGDLATPQLRF